MSAVKLRTWSGPRAAGSSSSLGGGAGVFDLEQDGLPDLMFAGGGRISATEISGAGNHNKMGRQVRWWQAVGVSLTAVAVALIAAGS